MGLGRSGRRRRELLGRRAQPPGRRQHAQDETRRSSAMLAAMRLASISHPEMVELVSTRLIGFDDEPVTAALCVANMILCGDGSSNVHRGDAFSAPEYPKGSASVVLMNPPYPHKKTDAPTEAFVNRGLEGLAQGGRLVEVIPQSLLVIRWQGQEMAQRTAGEGYARSCGADAGLPVSALCQRYDCGHLSAERYPASEEQAGVLRADRK